MEMMIALAASPLTDMHQPKTFDIRSLKHQLLNIQEIRKGLIKTEIKFDNEGDGKPHHSARVDLVSDMGTGFIEFAREETNWWYKGETNINGELTNYEGYTAHHSVQAVCRKVRGLLLKLL